MEYWNNVLKTYNFSVCIKVYGINFHYFIWFENYLPKFYLFAFFEEIQLLMFFLYIIDLSQKPFFYRCNPIKTQHSSIPVFHHSNCERNELICFCSACSRNDIFFTSNQDLEIICLHHPFFKTSNDRIQNADQYKEHPNNSLLPCYNSVSIMMV